MKRLNLSLGQARQLRLTGQLNMKMVVTEACEVNIAEPLILQSDEVEETSGGGVKVTTIYAKQPARSATEETDDLDDTHIPVRDGSGRRVADWLASNDYVDKTVHLDAHRVPLALLTLTGTLSPNGAGSLLTLTGERTEGESGLEVIPDLQRATHALRTVQWRLKQTGGRGEGGQVSRLLDQLEGQLRDLRSSLA